MKREELICPVVDEYYGECEWESHPNTYYYKSEADKVMDAMEARINELEAQLENVQSSMYAENVDANMALVKANERIKALEAEVKKWKQDNRYLSAFVHLLYKGKDANSTAVIAVANKMDELEAENARLKQANIDCNAHFATLKEDYDDLKTENEELTQTKNAYKTKYIALQNENNELKKELNQ